MRSRTGILPRSRCRCTIRSPPPASDHACRARSVFTTEGDASVYDPKARAGAKVKVGTVADWKEAHRYCTLVADGEHSYVPVETGTELTDAPRFLPDVFTGAKVAFLAPADAKSSLSDLVYLGIVLSRFW